MVGDKVAFKSIYGFVTGTPGGVRADTPTVTSAEEYTVGIPGQEVGLAARPGLSYGMTVTLQNRFNEFLQSDPNGWVYLRGSNGDWNHFDVLSPLHRQGLVEYGDDIILRSHNTKMLSAAPGGNLEAIKLIPDQDCVWTLVGGQGGESCRIPRSHKSMLIRSLCQLNQLDLLCSHPQHGRSGSSRSSGFHQRPYGRRTRLGRHVRPLQSVPKFRSPVQPPPEDVSRLADETNGLSRRDRLQI